MSYAVLARKWRPRQFKDMVGQEHILRMLTNALTQQRIHHAYLFTGTRGVGKTTLGRILAKCLNCETGITATPCGTCHICTAIDGGQFLDLYEVDAASRTKVEDTRELLENVCYPPSQGRYKIYLIDEVHMLSNHSFNALLKTLEEPPEHVKFILATTEAKRLPVTILSRCLQFHLKRISAEQITKHLQMIAATEKIDYEIAALEQLAKAADGSMRDALSLLDQAIAHGGGSVKLSDIYSLLGSVAQTDVIPLIEKLATKNSKELFQVIAQLTERAPDFQQLLEEITNLFHRLAIEQIIPDSQEASIISLAKQFSAEDIQLYYQIALLGKRDLTLTSNPQQVFEMTMLRMLAFHPATSAGPTSAGQAPKINATSTSAEQVTGVQVTNAEQVTAITSHTTSALTADKPEPAVIKAAVTINWRDLLPKLELTGMAHALAANCTLEKIDNNMIELAISNNHAPMLNSKLKDRIAEALSIYFKKTIQLTIHTTSLELVTPHKQDQQDQQQQLAIATQKVMQDPKVQQLISMYDATVDVSLL